MKLIILDGQTIIQDDLSWECMCDFGEVTECLDVSHEEDDVVGIIGDSDVVLVSKVPITASVMDRCPNVKYIGVTATGYNVVDVKAAGERGITVTNVPGYGTAAVAEFAFALLLELTRKAAFLNQTVQRGDWYHSKEFCYMPCMQESLYGKTMGIVGFGAIGRKAAEIAQAFGMKVLVYTGYPNPEMETERLHFVSFETLLKESDVVSLHCPLTPERAKIMNKEAFAMMKPTAYLINTARGGLIDEAALKEALLTGQIRGAGLDGLEKEPMKEDCPLIGIDNCIIAPHVAWATTECRSDLIKIIYENLKGYLEGNPKNVVS